MPQHVMEFFAAVVVVTVGAILLLPWVGGAMRDSQIRRRRDAQAAIDNANAYYEQEQRDLIHARLTDETIAALDECLSIIRGWAA